MRSADGVVPKNCAPRLGRADALVAIEEFHRPRITAAGPDDLRLQPDGFAGLEMFAVARGDNVQPRRYRIIVVNDHRDRRMRKVDLIRITAGRWRDQMEEHRLVAFVKIIVDWVEPDVHGTGSSGDADGRTLVHAIEPIVLAQPG